MHMNTAAEITSYLKIPKSPKLGKIKKRWFTFTNFLA